MIFLAETIEKINHTHLFPKSIILVARKGK